MQKEAKMACLYYATDAYERLGHLSREQIQQVADAASELSQRQPLWHCRKKEFTLPHIHAKISGLQVVAYLATAVDILSGHQITDNEMSAFCEWLKPARTLARRPKKQTSQ